jgi:hypothetical protein
MSLLDKTRALFALKKTEYEKSSHNDLSLTPPSWFEASDEPRFEPLFRDEPLLYTEGKIVEAHLVQANSMLFEPGDFEACPAVIVFSDDPYFEQHPDELAKVGHALYAYKNSEVDIPELRPFVAQITDERATYWSRELPHQITQGRRVYFSVILVFRKHLPSGILMASRFPILIAPEHTPATMVLPCQFWDDEYCTNWKAEYTNPNPPLLMIPPSEDGCDDLVVFYENQFIIGDLSDDELEDRERIVEQIEYGADVTELVSDSTTIEYDTIRKVRANTTTLVTDIKYHSDEDEDEEKTAYFVFDSVDTQHEAFELLATQTEGRLKRRELQLSRIRAAAKPLFVLGIIVMMTLIFRLASLQCLAGDCVDESSTFVRTAYAWVLTKVGPNGALTIGALLFSVTAGLWAFPRLRTPPLLRLLLPRNSREVIL